MLSVVLVVIACIQQLLNGALGVEASALTRHAQTESLSILPATHGQKFFFQIVGSLPCPAMASAW